MCVAFVLSCFAFLWLNFVICLVEILYACVRYLDDHVFDHMLCYINACWMILFLISSYDHSLCLVMGACI